MLYDVKGAKAFHRGEAESDAVGVRALDPLTLVIELEGPIGYFLSLLTYSVTYPVPRNTVETHGEDWTAVAKIVTNGPFRLESWQRGRRLVLTRNEMYHGRFQGNVEKVECLFLGGDIWSLANWDTRSLALYKTGDLDVIRIAEAVGQARQDHAKDHVAFPMFWTIYVSFDLSQPPFDDLRARQAFTLAIDSERYQNEVTKGLFAPATGGFLPPQMPGHSPGIGLPYDPDRARRLLAEAGYPDGHHFPKVKALGGTKQEAEYVQAQWRENLGVEVEWEVLDIVTAHEMASQEIPALFFVAWGANYPDPDSFLRVCFQQPYHNWHHEAYDKLVEEARQLTDQEQRLKLYRQADRILMEQIPLTPLFYGRLHFLVKPWVRNLRLAPTWEAFWKDVVIEPSQQPVRSKPTISQSPQSRTLRMALQAPTTLDPAMADDWSIQNQLFSGLVEESPDFEIVPDVAQSWEIEDGGRRYIFHLRNDVRWTDGTLVTAADFEYAWKRLLDSATAAPPASLLFDMKGAKAYHQGQISDAAEVGVRALNDVTLAVELEEPASYFLHLLAQDITFPMPRHAIEAHGAAWTAAEHFVTNGPFRVETWNWGEAAVLRRNPAYHGRFTGNVERVELKLSPWDTAANFRDYQADRADVLYSSFSFPEIDIFRQQHPEEYVSLPWLQTSYIGFDVSRPPFDDVRVRRAYALAIDKTRLASLPLGDEVVPADGGLIPVGLPGYSPGIAWTYDPVQARQLLAKAGYPTGQEFPRLDWLALIGEQMAEYLRQQWHNNLGLGLPPGEIVHMADFPNRFRQESPPLFLAGWVADYPDPDSFLRVAVLQSHQPIAGLRNEAYIDLVEQARRVTDPETRLELYRQADKILVEEAFVIPLTYGRGHLLVKPWVKRYPTSPAKWWFWKDVVIDPH